MKKVKGMLTVVFLLIATIGSAQAEKEGQKKPDAAKIIKKLDTNKDGKLDLAEVKASEKTNLIKNFSKIDTDKDGFVDLTEFKASIAKHQRAK